MKVGIVAFAFGTPSSILSNQRISKIANAKARETQATIYTQKDVNLGTNNKVAYTAEESDSPPPTLRIARGAAKWAKECEVQILWVVAAKPHMWRALRDTEMALYEKGLRVEVRPCTEIDSYPEDSWFCPESTQKRVTTRKEWWRRELILKLMPFWIYSRVAN